MLWTPNVILLHILMLNDSTCCHDAKRVQNGHRLSKEICLLYVYTYRCKYLGMHVHMDLWGSMQSEIPRHGTHMMPYTRSNMYFPSAASYRGSLVNCPDHFCWEPQLAPHLASQFNRSIVANKFLAAHAPPSCCARLFGQLWWSFLPTVCPACFLSPRLFGQLSWTFCWHLPACAVKLSAVDALERCLATKHFTKIFHDISTCVSLFRFCSYG